MEIIKVFKPYQSKETLEPQLINGELREWTVRSQNLKLNQTFNNWLNELKERFELREKKSFKGIYLYDISTHSVINYDSAMIVRYQIIE